MKISEGKLQVLLNSHNRRVICLKRFASILFACSMGLLLLRSSRFMQIYQYGYDKHASGAGIVYMKLHKATNSSSSNIELGINRVVDRNMDTKELRFMQHKRTQHTKLSNAAAVHRGSKKKFPVSKSPFLVLQGEYDTNSWVWCCGLYLHQILLNSWLSSPSDHDTTFLLNNVHIPLPISVFSCCCIIIINLFLDSHLLQRRYVFLSMKIICFEFIVQLVNLFGLDLFFPSSCDSWSHSFQWNPILLICHHVHLRVFPWPYPL